MRMSPLCRLADAPLIWPLLTEAAEAGCRPLALLQLAFGSVTIIDRDGLEEAANGLYGRP